MGTFARFLACGCLGAAVLSACSHPPASAPDMASVPAGWSPMGEAGGRPDEQPARSVYLDAYSIDRHEVTNAEYAAFVAATDGRPPTSWLGTVFATGTADHPVVGISWDEAAGYCAWAGKRLPTEAEWERACRGPDGLRFPWGDEWQPGLATVTMVPLGDPDDAWPWLADPAAAPAAPAPVGSRPGGASGYGVHDLAGNAAEWVADWYDPAAYARLPDTNPVGDGPPWNHSIRGSSWLFRHADESLMVDQDRCAFRNASHSADDPRVGFRCAADG